MNKRDAVTVEDVRRVAELANLELTTLEEQSMQRDLSAILDYVAQLNELDTLGVEPMSQVSEMLGNTTTEGCETLRADVIVPSMDRTAVMASAPESDGRFFKVPKVIER